MKNRSQKLNSSRVAGCSLTSCSLLFISPWDGGSLVDVVILFFIFGTAVGMVIIGPTVASQRLIDDVMMGEFDSDEQWNALRADQHYESHQIEMQKSRHAVWHRSEPARAENPTAAVIASSGTRKLNVRRSTRLLRLLGKLLLPRPKRFRVSWGGIISSTNSTISPPAYRESIGGWTGSCERGNHRSQWLARI
jgi:hypothetical protein